MPARRARTCSSFSRLRPASAQRSDAGAVRARYSAVSPPVNPVAPNRTMSYARLLAMALPFQSEQAVAGRQVENFFDFLVDSHRARIDREVGLLRHFERIVD